VNVVGEWGRVFARALAENGVRDVVVSPGSRSTPFVLAVDAEPSLTITVVIDERAAAFHALGRTRISGDPVALLCTSGTAAANYLPAVVEADAAGLPLVVITADRPPSLMACGANQTIEQLTLFRGRTRLTLDLGLPRADIGSMRAMRRAVCRAVSESTHPSPGPVHLDARAEKPLEPGPASSELDRRAEDAARLVLAEPATRFEAPRSAPTDEALDQMAERIARAERPVVVAGPQLPSAARAGAAIAEFCRDARVPLLAESTSQHRFRGRARTDVPVFDAFDLAWRTESGRRELDPDLVVQVGAYPVSKGYAQLIEAEDGPARLVVSEHGWPDPHGTAEVVCRADAGLVFAGLSERTSAPVRDDGFLRRIAAADRALSHVVEGVLGEGGFGEAAVARAVVSNLPEGAILVVGNSLPVRELDLVCPGRLGDFPVVSQRGVSGIDGLVSGAAGVAAQAGRPTLLYVGDVSFLHDVGGLSVARGLTAPLVIVVANNDGGRIFEQLPVARLGLDEAALRRFTTPHGLGFAHAAALYGHRFESVEDASALGRAIARGAATPGCTVVEARVPPPAAAAELASLLAGAERALTELSS